MSIINTATKSNLFTNGSDTLLVVELVSGYFTVYKNGKRVTRHHVRLGAAQNRVDNFLAN